MEMMPAILMIVAVLVAPTIAVRTERFLEQLRQKKRRKSDIFQTLMATRGERLSPEHVKALNRIDLVFQAKGDKRIIEAWKIYLDHLNTPMTSSGKTPTPEEEKPWIAKGDDLFIDLLYEMGQLLEYDFDKVHLKKGVYTPQAFGEQWYSQVVIRNALIGILTGTQALQTRIVASDEEIQRQEQLNTMLREYLEGKRAVKVIVEEQGDKVSAKAK